MITAINQALKHVITWQNKTSRWIGQKLYCRFNFGKIGNPLGYILLSVLSIFMALATASLGIAMGAFLLALLLGIPIGLVCLLNIRLGFLLIIIVSSFTFFIPRITGLYDFPFGSITDVLLLLTFCGIFVNKEHRFQKLTAPNNIIFYMILLWISYLIFQLFNPNSISVEASLFSVRGILGYIITYFILIRLFDTRYYVKVFTITWLAISLLAALYAFYQEFAGLPQYDLSWVTRNPKSIGLAFIRGRWRKWSFLSDPATFGMFMSFAGVFSLVLAMGVQDLKKRVILLFMSVLFLISMTYSGTRTAVAMTLVGIVFYGVLSLHRKSTLLVGASTVFVLLAIMYVPYYSSPTINSIRSTFSPDDDASFNVRVENKEMIQPYIRSHPIGGGLNTTGALGESIAPDHPLAGFPPDSYYMALALEVGWIGLGLYLFIFFVILVVGLLNYKNCKDLKIKAYYAAYLSSFFALTVAGYVQESITQRPMGFVFYGCFVLMDSLKYLDQPTSRSA